MGSLKRDFAQLILMNATQYKQYHESFMKNNDGSTALHVFLRISFTVICSLFASLDKTSVDSYQYTYEYVSTIITMTVANTIFAADFHYLYTAISSLLILNLLLKVNELDLEALYKEPNRFENDRLASITVMRGLTYLITTFCILAVDFQVFPRYLAKTQKYGYSLMDTGVGLFVLMSGIVHRLRADDVLGIIMHSSKLLSVLIFLGFSRYFTIKKLDYHEVVEEYGVHWNFFYTLGLSKFFSTILLTISPNNAFTFSVVTLGVHELLLQFGLQAWVFSDIPRNDYISANREGISSCLGFTALYLFGVHIKQLLQNRSLLRSTVQSNLITGAIFLWVMSVVTNIFLPASRVLANASYCLFVEAILMTVMSLLYFLEVIFHDKEKKTSFEASNILQDINDNGLVYFLVSNILTGIINLFLKTLLFPDEMAFFIITLYMVTTTCTAIFLKKMGFKL